MMDSVSRKEMSFLQEENFLKAQRSELRNDRLDLWCQIDIAAERKTEERAMEIFRRVERQYHVPLLLVLYSVVVTIFLIVTYEPDFASVRIFGERFWHGFSRIWEAGWPFVFVTLKATGSNDLTAWMLTIIAAMFAALLTGAIIVLFVRVIRGLSDVYRRNSETAKGIEAATAVIVTAVLASLIITGLCKTEITWVGLALTISSAGNLICHSIYFIKNEIKQQ